MGGLATGATFVLIPENPPSDGWEDAMCRVLRAGRESGRRASIVLVAALAVVVVYMTWVGASGQPLPQWLLWITTVL